MIWVLQSLGTRWSKLLQYDMSVLEAVARLTHIRPHQLLTPYRSGCSSAAKVSPAVTEPHQLPRNNSRQHPRIAKGDMLSHSLTHSLSLSLSLALSRCLSLLLSLCHSLSLSVSTSLSLSMSLCLFASLPLSALYYVSPSLPLSFSLALL